MPNNNKAMPNNNRVMPNNSITIILADLAPHKELTKPPATQAISGYICLKQGFNCPNFSLMLLP